MTVRRLGGLIDLSNVSASGLNGTTDDHADVTAFMAQFGPGAAFLLPWDRTIVVSQPLKMRPDHYIVGEGRGGGTIRAMDSITSINVVESTSGSRFGLRDIRISGNKANTMLGSVVSSCGVRMIGGSLEAHNLEVFDSHGYGLLATDSASVHVTGGSWTDNDRGISLSDTDHVLSDVDVSRNTFGFVHHLGGSGTLVNVTAHDCVSQGITATHALDGFSWTNCNANNNGVNGIVAGGSGGAVHDNKHFTILGSSAEGNGGHGFSIDPTQPNDDTAKEQYGTIAGCVSRNNGVHGYNISHVASLPLSGLVAEGNGHSGVAVTLSRDVTISNLTSDNNTRYGLVFYGLPAEIATVGGHRVTGLVTNGNLDAPVFVDPNQGLGVSYGPDVGTTAERNPYPIIGTMFFDTTLGTPVWWDGAQYVDGTGAAA